MYIYENFEFDFSQFCLIFQSKYKFIIMRLRLQPRASKNLITKKLIIKIVLAVALFLGLVFLLGKIEMPSPNKLIKQEISNDKLITLK